MEEKKGRSEENEEVDLNAKNEVKKIFYIDYRNFIKSFL